MAYIETHQSLLTHRKTLRLGRLLGMDRFAVAGRLMALWCWALDNTPEGVIGGADGDILADVMGWDGEPSALCDALVSAGFLEAAKGAYVIHDWYDYAGKLIEKRKSDADRKRISRASVSRPQEVHRTSVGQRTDGAGTVPNRTVTLSPMHEESVTTSFAAAVADGTAALRVAPVDSAPEPKPAGTILTLPVQAPAPKPTPAEQSPSPRVRRAPLPDAEAAPDVPVQDRKSVNSLWDALVAAFGYEPKTAPERSKWGKVVKDLRAVEATPEQVRERCRNHAALTTAGALHWTLTPPALAAHWGELGKPPKTAQATMRASPGRPQPPAPVFVPAGSKDIWA